MQSSVEESVYDLPEKERTLKRTFYLLVEQIEAIRRYTQHISQETDLEAKHLMLHSRNEEFRHATLSLAFLIEKLPEWKSILQATLFMEGNPIDLVNAIPEPLWQEVQPVLTGEELLKEFLSN